MADGATRHGLRDAAIRTSHPRPRVLMSAGEPSSATHTRSCDEDILGCTIGVRTWLGATDIVFSPIGISSATQLRPIGLAILADPFGLAMIPPRVTEDRWNSNCAVFPIARRLATITYPIICFGRMVKFHSPWNLSFLIESPFICSSVTSRPVG
jgi:hypothetical protein